MEHSLFRKMQNQIVRQFAGDCSASTVVEWGADMREDYRTYFPPGVAYIMTNILPQEGILEEDITALTHPSDSVECALCISVLQHVFELDKAIAEIVRVLKPGGRCLITNGYMFPVCMEEDYYRLTPAYWYRRLQDEPVHFEVILLGNKYDAIDSMLMRPYGQYNSMGKIVNKALSWPFKCLRRLVANQDSAPLGVAVIIVKLKNDITCKANKSPG